MSAAAILGLLLMFFLFVVVVLVPIVAISIGVMMLFRYWPTFTKGNRRV